MKTIMDVPTYVYVLRNPKGHYYSGITDRLDSALSQHNAGVIDFTRYKGPWNMVWAQQFESLAEAQRYENLLKKQKGTSGFTKLTGLSA